MNRDFFSDLYFQFTIDTFSDFNLIEIVTVFRAIFAPFSKMADFYSENVYSKLETTDWLEMIEGMSSINCGVLVVGYLHGRRNHERLEK